MQTTHNDSLERRSKVRFPVQLNVRYRTLIGPQLSGAGQTLNMSSGGLLIASDRQFVRAGTRLQLTIEWPLLLQGMTPLQLSAACQVVRCQDALFAVRMERYQFRTRKREEVAARVLVAASA